LQRANFGTAVKGPIDHNQAGRNCRSKVPCSLFPGGKGVGKARPPVSLKGARDS
jgi:hypothetical protein